MTSLSHSRNGAGKGFRANAQRAAFTWVELLIAVVVVVVVFVLFAGTGCRLDTIEKVKQAKDLYNARQVYAALMSFATDHNGVFPDKTEDGRVLTNANEAYENLVPKYISAETCFWLRQSAWSQDNPPDEVITKGNCLVAGENAYAYVPCLSSTSNSNIPLVADGFKEGHPGVYVSDIKEKGGVWAGKKAVVVRVDGSAAPELVNMEGKVLGRTSGRNRADIFAPAPGWLAPENKPLNPASK